MTTAKVNPPRLPPVHARYRIFREFDGLREHPVVWVSGPAGSGKTTAIVSYLDSRRIPLNWYDVDAGDADPAAFFHYLGLLAAGLPKARTQALPLFGPEYREGLPVFARRFFEALFAALPRPAALVFDNYQEVPAEGSMHDILREAFEVVPRGLRLFIASRTEPPPLFARALANRRLARLGWEALRFSEKEAQELVALRGARRRAAGSRATAAEIHRMTDGWAAGMIVLLEAHLGGVTVERPDAGDSLETVFEYFATEVLNQVDAATAQVLLATSFLPNITAASAEAVSGARNAGQILARLHRQNLFTVRRQSSPPQFVYHPLFRAFLMRRAAERLGREAVSEVRRRAARVLAAAGQPGDAIDLLRQEADWQAAVPLVLEHAPRLLATGQVPTLLDWLSWLPGEAFATDGNPWLLLWRATAVLHTDPGQSLPLWRTAFDRFRARGDAAGMFLSWAGAVQAVVVEEKDFRQLDEWFHELQVLEDVGLTPPSPDVEAKVASAALLVVMFRSPEGSDGRRWADRAQRAFAAATTLGDQALLGSTIAFYETLMCSDFHRAQDALVALSRLTAHIPDPAVRFRLLYAQAFFAANANLSVQDATAAVDAGLHLAEECGIYLYRDQLLQYGVLAGIASGNPAVAERYLERTRERVRSPHGESFLQFTYGWYVFEFEGPEAALPCAQRALDLCDRTGFIGGTVYSHLAIACSLIELGRLDEAGQHLHRSEEIIRTHQLWMTIQLSAMLVRAHWLGRQGQDIEALAALTHVLQQARQTRLAAGTYLPRRALARLCAIALDANVEPEFARALIQMRRLTPTAGHRSLRWPWPLAFRTLGTFAISVDGRPLVFQGKTPRVPLRIAKALAAAGGQAVTQSQLIDAFWPDADGDAAKRSLDTAVHRLRRLLTHDDAIVTEDGTLRLVLDRAFVDAAEIEPLTQEIEALRGDTNQSESPGLQRRLEHLLELYRGPFLPGEDDLPGVLARRASLRRAFVNALVVGGTALEAMDRRQEALAFYYRGLAVEETAEPLYQRALIAHAALGQRDEGARLFERCRQTLARALGTSPSAETRGAFESTR